MTFRLAVALACLWSGLALADVATSADLPPFAVAGDNLIKLTAPHPFSRDEARTRIGFLLDYWNKRFGVTGVWVGYQCFMSGRVWSVDFKARFEISEGEVHAEATDPGWVLRARAQHYVEGKLKKYLHPAYAAP